MNTLYQNSRDSQHAPATLTPATLTPATLTPAVLAMASIPFDGDIIPSAWLQSPLFRRESGLVNFPALHCLANICYWFRPVPVHDETGAVVGFRKKFAADKLQWNHTERAKRLGLTPRQAEDAIAFLRNAGLITTELRDHVQTANGALLFNQVYVEPVVELIALLNGAQKVTLPAPVSPSSTRPVLADTPPRSDGHPTPPKRVPSTKSSTKIPSNNVERLEVENLYVEKEESPGLPDELPPAVEAIVELTGDTRSVARFLQLYAICCEKHGLTGIWKQAFDQTARWLRVTPPENRRSGKGAYFDVTVRRLMEAKQVFLPNAREKIEQAGIRSAIAASLGGTACG